jgi:hypothetical protein
MKTSFCKHLAAAALLCFGSFAQAQVSLTATGGTSTGSFSTLNAAFTAINAGTHTGSIVVTVTGNTTEPATPVPLVASGTGSASYTKILIKPSGNDTINSASSPTASRGIIELAGADHVTIDGDDPSTSGAQNLTIMAATSSSSGIACIRLGSTSTSGTDGASNDTVRNCIIIGSRNSATSTTTNYGIQFNSVASSNTSSTGAYSNLNNAIIGNTIKRCHRAIYAYGASSSYPNTGTLIEGNTIGSSTGADNVVYGVYLYYTATSTSGGPAVVRGNDIQAGEGSTGISSSVYGIYVSSYNYGTVISGNNIHDVVNPKSSGYGAHGIYISSATDNDNIRIYNNFIRDITTTNSSSSLTTTSQNFGIYINAAVDGLKINHNTIYLNAANATTSSASNEVSACINIGSSTAVVSQMLNNILVNNQGSVSSNAYCIIVDGSTAFSTGTVNNNSYYVNGSGSVGYFGGAAQSTLPAWRTATGKDANSVRELPAFTSATNLHIPAATNSQLESGGATVSVTGISSDIDGQTRPGPTGSTSGGGTAPDIGADEFDGAPVQAPSISNAAASAISCTSNIAHTVTATVVANSGTIDSVVIIYNNGSAGRAVMTLSTGTTSNGVWTGTIPAATVAGTTVTWSITATSSIPLSKTAIGPSYQDVPLTGVTATAYATPDSVCAGSSTTLSTRAIRAGGVQIGSGSSTSSSSGTPYYHLYGGAKVQYIYTAAELRAAGLDSGNISALAFDVTSTGTSYANFEISMGATTQSAFSASTALTGLATVYSSSSVTPTVGINTYTFSIPFYWNGTDNLVVSICWSNNNTGGSSTTVSTDNLSATQTLSFRSDNKTASTMCGLTGTSSGIYATVNSTRPVIIFTGPKLEPSTAYSWSDGTTTVGTTNPLIVTPTANTSYTATLTSTGGCTLTSNAVAVALVPLPTAPTAINSAQCGYHVPTASVSGAPAGSTYKWYSAATGGTLLQTGGSTYTRAVSTTTTFYVAIDNGRCESIRIPVTVTVTNPDAITASSSSAPFCLNSSISLSVTKAPGSNNYTYTWTASPATGSGMSSPVTGSTSTVTPTQLGTYVYTVTAVDGACAAVSSITAPVLLPPPAPTVTPKTATAFCLGGSQALTALPGIYTLFRDTFETFPLTQWTTTGTNITAAQDVNYYKEGSSSVGLTYTTNADGQLTMTDSVDLSKYSSPMLSFYQICATEASWDYGYVQYSTDNGSTWNSFPTSAYLGSGTTKNSVVSFDKSSYSDWASQFTSATATPGTGPATSLWKLEKIDLSAYASSTQFKIRFAITSDGSVNYYGWLVDSVAISSSPAVTFAWSSSPAGFSATAQNATATPTVAGTYTFTAAAIGTNGCRTTASTANVVVRPLPNFSFTPANAAICFGESLTITASGASTYSWSPATGLNTTTSATVTANPTATTSYKVIGTTALGCVDSIMKTVTVNPIPTVSVTPAADTICLFSSSTLTASGAATYAWSPASGLSAATGAVVSASPSANTNYKVIGTDVNGCKDSAAAGIVVKPVPSVSIAATANSTICGSGSVGLTASGAISYTWSPTTGLNTTTGVSVTATPATSTIYQVTGTAANGCSGTDTQQVFVYALPVVAISPAGPLTICGGFSTTLTATGASTYAWSPSSSLNSPTGATVTATPGTTTTYTVTGTDIHGCSAAATKAITVNYGPTVTVSPATAVICIGDSIMLTASGVAASFSWSPSTGLNTTSGTTVIAKPFSTITYSVIAQNPTGCSTLVKKVVTVNPLPSVAVSPSTAVICLGHSISLAASGASTYSWTPSAGLNTPAGATVSASPSGTTAYTVTGTDINGCKNSAMRTVTVNPVPNVSMSPSASPTICQGTSVTLSATGASSYVWSPATGLSSTTSASVSASPSTTTIYRVIGSNSFGCTDTVTRTVNVNPKPTVVINPASVTVCAGHGDSLHASGAASYVWTPGGTLSSTTAADVFARPGTSTSYTVTGTDVNGCVNTATRLVTVLPVPNVTTAVGNNSRLCPGDSVHITAFGAVNYLWYPASSLSASSGSAVWAYPQATTTYSVVGTAANGCTDTAQRTVTAYPKPDASITPAGHLNICQYDSVTLSVGSGYVDYRWMIYGATIAPAMGDMLTTGTGGYYTVQVTDSNGCIQTTAQPTIVTIVQRPVPVIRQEDAWLDAGAGYLRYQWYLAGAPVPGADSQWYLPVKSGVYTVEVTADTLTNCPGKSDELMYTAVGVDGQGLANAVRLYPNPANDIVRIESPVAVEVSITGMDGKLIFQGSDIKQLSVAGWPDGVYQVTLRNRNGGFIKAVKLTKLTR